MDRERAQTTASFLVGAIFATLLALPAVDAFLHLDRTPPPQERRTLAGPPRRPHSMRELASLPPACDAFVRDHFGFRSFLIRLEARATILWLGVPPSPEMELMVGRDGWLYYTGDDSISFAEGTRMFSQGDLGLWLVALRQRHDWLARRGIRYLVVFAPGSPTVYPEHLPGWIRPSTHGTRLDQLVGALRLCPEISVLDLRPNLLGAKRLARLYTPTDTHWNAFGAFVGYDAIMNALTRWFPQARPASFAAFNTTWQETHGGDIAEMADIHGLVTEKIPVVVPRLGFRAATLSPSQYGTLRKWDPLKGPVVTESPGAPIPRAVILRDSYFNALIPLLSEHIGRAVYLWITDFDASVVERERPDLVIQEYTERLLMDVTPTNPPALAVGPEVRQGAE